MALYGVLEFTSIAEDDLQTAPNPDGSDFGVNQIIEPQPGLFRLDINIAGKAVEELNIVLRLYRWEPEFNRACRAASFTLKDDEVITDNANFEYRALETIEIGAGKHFLVLEDGELGAALTVVWRLVANGSI